MKITGSALERLERCPASGVLRGANSTTEASLIGTANHLREELAIDGDGEMSPVVRKAVEDSDIRQTEVAYAINLVSGSVRILGLKLGRNYGTLGQDEIALTVDLVCLDTRAVWDWKSRKRVTHVRDNPQLLAAAYAAATANGWDSVHVGIGYLNDNESDEATLDSLDIAAILPRLQRIRAGIARAKEDVEAKLATGPWCDYCPSFAWCPAQTRLARAMAGELDDMLGQVAMWTPEQCGVSWERLKRIEDIADRVKAAVRTRVKREFIPLPDGKRLAMVESSRTSPDAKAMAARLRELGEDPDKYTKTSRFTAMRETKA